MARVPSEGLASPVGRWSQVGQVPREGQEPEGSHWLSEFIRRAKWVTLSRCSLSELSFCRLSGVTKAYQNPRILNLLTSESRSVSRG